jgi:hypothetical protein
MANLVLAMVEYSGSVATEFFVVVVVHCFLVLCMTLNLMG